MATGPRMAPPLTITDDEIDLAVTTMDDALTTVTDRQTTSVLTHTGD